MLVNPTNFMLYMKNTEGAPIHYLGMEKRAVVVGDGRETGKLKWFTGGP